MVRRPNTHTRTREGGVAHAPALSGAQRCPNAHRVPLGLCLCGPCRVCLRAAAAAIWWPHAFQRHGQVVLRRMHREPLAHGRRAACGVRPTAGCTRQPRPAPSAARHASRAIDCACSRPFNLFFNFLLSLSPTAGFHHEGLGQGKAASQRIRACHAAPPSATPAHVCRAVLLPRAFRRVVVAFFAEQRCWHPRIVVTFALRACLIPIFLCVNLIHRNSQSTKRARGGSCALSATSRALKRCVLPRSPIAAPLKPHFSFFLCCPRCATRPSAACCLRKRRTDPLPELRGVPRPARVREMCVPNMGSCEVLHARGVCCVLGRAGVLRPVACLQETCKHWLNGLCRNGDPCEFLHRFDLYVQTPYFSLPTCIGPRQPLYPFSHSRVRLF